MVPGGGGRAIGSSPASRSRSKAASVSNSMTEQHYIHPSNIYGLPVCIYNSEMAVSGIDSAVQDRHLVSLKSIVGLVGTEWNGMACE